MKLLLNKIINALFSFIGLNANDTTVLTSIHATLETKQYNPYKKGNATCDQCGNKVSKVWNTTIPVNCIDETPKKMCDYCYCTLRTALIPSVDLRVYNVLRSRYNLSRKV